MILLRDLARRLPEWDAPVKFALALAVILLLLLLALGFGGPQEIQFPARVGAFGLLVTLQILYLWANRRDISPYHQAQKRFVAGDYQAARSLLEGIPEAARISVDALALLGNCYRHLGLYDKSGAALEQALQIKPNHHLALFSRGKLSLVTGEYSNAASMILRALDAGSPDIVRFELGQTYFLLGDYERANTQFVNLGTALADDPPFDLMIRYCLYRMGKSAPPSLDLIRAGIDYWRAEADKHKSAPYGAATRLAVDELENQLAGH